jgi:D-3-phosphoglycerate dehydrogenase
MANGSAKHRVVITGRIAEEAIRLLVPTCEVECTKPYLPPAEFGATLAAAKADALLVRGVAGKVTREVMEASPNLRVIAKHGVGVDNIDVAAATDLRIAVLNTPAANYESVAEHVLALMLALAKDISCLDGRMRDGQWDKMGYRGRELLGKTLGLVGFGRIGRRVQELVAPLRMRVLVFDPLLAPEWRWPDVTRVDTLAPLLQAADVVSLHCPLTEKTRGLIGRREFQQMKTTAWLINTARGAVVDEEALIAALEAGEIAGAGLDTFNQEPPADLARLVKAGKTVLTPHVAGVTEESFVRMGVTAAEGILRVLAGEAPDPQCWVNHFE